MNLIRTSALSLIATAIKIISALVINKAIALYIGPAGLALLGQFQNFSQMVLTAAEGAISSGVIKYTAEYKEDNARIPALFSTAAKISLFSSSLVGAGIVVISKYISLNLFNTVDYDYIFVIYGFTIVLFVANNLLLSILNGLKEIKTWVMITIIQSIYSLTFTTLLILALGLDGALIALITNQSVIFLIVLWMLRNHRIIKLANFRGAFDKPEAKKLGKFALMGITSAVTIPVSHLIVRNYLGKALGWDDAGYWQAIWYISTTYLTVVTSVLSIYYLPKLSEITDKIALRKEILQGYKIIMPIVTIMSVTIFLLKDFIIWLLFTKEFTPIRELFLWQLAGDVMKLAAWLMAYLMMAKAMTKTFIVTEITFSLSFVLLSMWFVDEYGLVGMSYSFALNYTLYFFLMIYVTKSEWDVV